MSQTTLSCPASRKYADIDTPAFSDTQPPTGTPSPRAPS